MTAFLTTDEARLDALATEALLARLSIQRRYRDPLRYRVALRNVLAARGVRA